MLLLHEFRSKKFICPDKKNNKDKKPQPQQNKMSKEQADQLLKALMNSEKKLQDKRKQKQEDGANLNIEKDW
jgi:hypothetical protein